MMSIVSSAPRAIGTFFVSLGVVCKTLPLGLPGLMMMIITRAVIITQDPPPISAHGLRLVVVVGVVASSAVQRAAGRHSWVVDDSSI
jgi:hypothetical protein